MTRVYVKPEPVWVDVDDPGDYEAITEALWRSFKENGIEYTTYIEGKE